MNAQEKSLRREARYFGETAAAHVGAALRFAIGAEQWRTIAAQCEGEDYADARELALKRAGEEDAHADRMVERAVKATVRAIANANLSIGER